jgi:hypothetical protein
MISVSNTVRVNEDGEEVILTRDDVWHGLNLKAENALPFVPAMTKCEFIERTDEGAIIRDIVYRGQEARELVTFTPKEKVQFHRLSGDVHGDIYNIIGEDENGNLTLTFSYDLVLPGVEAGGPEEQEYSDRMSDDYKAVVIATLAALRRWVAEGKPAVEDITSV